MKVINRVPELVAAKFGGESEINLTEVQAATGMNYRTVSSWVKGHVTRADFPVLVKWCEYLGVKPGDILTLEE